MALRRAARSGAALAAALAAGMCGAVAQAQGADAPAAQPAETAVLGAQLFRARCQACHGPNMVLAGGAAYDLRRFPLDDPERFSNSVRQGRGAMPAWKDVLSDSEVAQLWAYVRTRGKPPP